MKTNKTKPIKKIMIFTIITVMIVSLFAVPAFAALPFPENPTGFIEPEQYTDIWGNTQTTENLYAITISWDDLARVTDSMAMNTMNTLTFDLFGPGSSSSSEALPNYRNGVAKVVLDDDSVSWYSLNVHDGGDEYVVYLRAQLGSSGSTLFFPNAQFSYDSVTNSTNVSTITFFLENYPPVGVTGDSAAFWNQIDYQVYSVGTPVTPEDPDTPIPPADGEEQGIFAVWSQITQWIVQGLASVSNAFYANGELTLLGTLCIIPLALGLAFLLIGIIQKFLRLRG